MNFIIDNNRFYRLVVAALIETNFDWEKTWGQACKFVKTKQCIRITSSPKKVLVFIGQFGTLNTVESSAKMQSLTHGH